MKNSSVNVLGYVRVSAEGQVKKEDSMDEQREEV